MAQRTAFEIERDGETAILTPCADREGRAVPQVEIGAGEVWDVLTDPAVRNVLVDFHRTEDAGTTALGVCLKLRQAVRSRDGHMAFCNVSPQVQETLRRTKLNCLWAIWASREEAMQAVRQ
jgi:anti-anti-sigma factor